MSPPASAAVAAATAATGAAAVATGREPPLSRRRRRRLTQTACGAGGGGAPAAGRGGGGGGRDSGAGCGSGRGGGVGNGGGADGGGDAEGDGDDGGGWRPPPPLLIDELTPGGRRTASGLAVHVPELRGTLHFFTFETATIDECVRFLGAHWGRAHSPGGGVGARPDEGIGRPAVPPCGRPGDAAADGGGGGVSGGGGGDGGGGGGGGGGGDGCGTDGPGGVRLIRATGGGAYKYADLFATVIGVQLVRLDEMACTVAGLNLMLTRFEAEVYEFHSTAERPPSPASSPAKGQAHAKGGHAVANGLDDDSGGGGGGGGYGNPFPYLLVNIGSGVSIVHVTGYGQFTRISGSSLGGGTFWGLSRLLTHCKTFDEVIELTKAGDNAAVDMLVGDIYGAGGYGALGLSPDVIAASFGKVTMRRDEEGGASGGWRGARAAAIDLYRAVARAVIGTFYLWLGVLAALPGVGGLARAAGLDALLAAEPLANTRLARHFHAPDVALSLLRMVSYNIGQVAVLNARLLGLHHVYFGGNFVRDVPYTMHAISYAVGFWSDGDTVARFLKHDGFLGAVGAFLNADSTPPSGAAGGGRAGG
ncbi:hypothetical protein BU14_0678s0004 [Porphyra umbilicalis]|uniref:Pantothenate kinase n=1 Tax=Porphyra umbilicalis TaxID=2786 RepID=A0A1X6NQE9_PORUM|nr:hypothetical protein BU14_0678s0004 [Porphyra umbilicalis]|eukprot:OSX70726.1 hypothetical protein BU14_0678s0004 [Porphyra umbilicalis]